MCLLFSKLETYLGDAAPSTVALDPYKTHHLLLLLGRGASHGPWEVHLRRNRCMRNYLHDQRKLLKQLARRHGMGFGRVAGYGARWIWKWIGVDMDGPMGGYKTTLSNQLAVLTDHPSVFLYDIHERQVPYKSSLVYVRVWFRLHG